MVFTAFSCSSVRHATFSPVRTREGGDVKITLPGIVQNAVFNPIQRITLFKVSGCNQFLLSLARLTAFSRLLGSGNMAWLIWVVPAPSPSVQL